MAEYVQTHYGAGDAHTKWDENAASGTVEKAGFSYSYELVGYIDGSNKTSQSAHAALNRVNELQRFIWWCGQWNDQKNRRMNQKQDEHSKDYRL